MFETFLLASDADEKEKRKPICQECWNAKICSSHLGKGQSNRPIFTVMEKSFRAIIHCNLKRQLSDWALWFWYHWKEKKKMTGKEWGLMAHSLSGMFVPLLRSVSGEWLPIKWFSLQKPRNVLPPYPSKQSLLPTTWTQFLISIQDWGSMEKIVP